MPHVVCAPCQDCKYTDCVEACPVPGGCFREGERQLYIDPNLCIDCSACMPRCPVEAIYPEEYVPAEWQSYIALNAAEAPKCPPITEKKVR